MLTSDINLGESIVVAWLRTHGYFRISIVSSGPHHYIEADGGRRRMLVIVKAATFPEVPGSIENDELQPLLEFATSVERECWIAYLQLDIDNNLVDDIKWVNLS